MDDTNSLIEQRKTKLAALRARGIDPFKNKFTPAETCQQARANYAEGREVALAGRITAHRDMGKSMFMDIRDQSGRIQVYAQKNALGDEQWDIFKHLDLADFIGVRGTMFTTKTNEISVKITSFVILAKALRPPPAKWHGLEDTEIRYRQRYLDLMANPEVKDIFLKRSQIIAEVRNFLHTRGYVEVETPMMQAIPGGAAAQPFVTKHNALGCNFYLRIALELYLKRLLVGGVDKVFEIGRNFRNEGLSRKHNPEFTMLEAYEAYGDYESMMELVQNMICHAAEKVLGTLKIEHNRKATFTSVTERAIHELDEVFAKTSVISLKGETKLQQEEIRKLRDALVDFSKRAESEPPDKLAKEILESHSKWSFSVEATFGPESINNPDDYADSVVRDAHLIITKWKKFYARFIEEVKTFQSPKIIDLTSPWRRAKYKDLVREKAGADWFDVSPEVRRQRAHDLGAEITKDCEDFEVTGAVFEKLIEPTLIQPTFVTHLPKELVPLAKISPEDSTTVEVFECCINGQEISPGYTEQNDPIEQRERLEHQAGGEQQKLDEDFLIALEHGMPPAGGIGIGIDRLCMMLLGQESIRDVILFPQLKPK
jgi:lysyl-tRNA synthetase class 2